MFERYGVDTDELPTHREMGLDLDSDSPDIDGEDPWHPKYSVTILFIGAGVEVDYVGPR